MLNIQIEQTAPIILRYDEYNNFAPDVPVKVSCICSIPEAQKSINETLSKIKYLRKSGSEWDMINGETNTPSYLYNSISKEYQGRWYDILTATEGIASKVGYAAIQAAFDSMRNVYYTHTAPIKLYVTHPGVTYSSGKEILVGDKVKICSPGICDSWKEPFIGTVKIIDENVIGVEDNTGVIHTVDVEKVIKQVTEEIL